MKKEKNQLSNLSYRYRGLPDVPIHHLHRIAANKFSNRIEETKKKHWRDWLEEATSSNVYLANKYITNPLTDYASARISSLVTTSDNSTESTTHENKEKAEALQCYINRSVHNHNAALQIWSENIARYLVFDELNLLLMLNVL